MGLDSLGRGALFECCCGMGLGRMPYVSGEERGCWLHLFKCSLYLMNGVVLRVAGVFVVWKANVPPVESSLSIRWKANVPPWEKNRYTAGRRGSAVSCLCSIVGIRGEGSCLGKARSPLDRVKGIWCLRQPPLDEYFADSRRMCIFAVHWLGEP